MSKLFIFLLLLIFIVYFLLGKFPAFGKKRKTTPAKKKNGMRPHDPLQLVAGHPLVLAALAALAVYNRPNDESINDGITETILTPLSSAEAAAEASVVARTLYRSLNDPVALIDNSSQHMVSLLTVQERQQLFMLVQENLSQFGADNSPFYLNRLRRCLLPDAR